MPRPNMGRMPVIRLGHYNLRAPSPLLERLRDFYCEVVGLNVGWRPAFGSRGYWLYAGGRDVLHLTECAPGRLTPDTGFDHAAFDCSDLPAHEERLMRLGVGYETARVPGTDSVQLFLRDPAGHGVELHFAPPDS